MYILMVLVLAAVIFYLECLAGGGLSVLVDVPSLIMLVAVGIPTLLASGLGRDFLAAFRLALGKGQQAGLEEWKRALQAVRIFMQTMQYGGMFFMLTAMVNILIFVDDTSLIPANVGVGLVVLLYAYVLKLLLLPIQSRLEVGIIEYMKNAGTDGEEEGESMENGR